MANLEILDLSQKDKWTRYFNKLPEQKRDIFYTPQYYELCEQNGDGKATCFVYEQNDDIALYPFLTNSINELGLIKEDREYYDIQGANGYNGVISSSLNSDFRKNFSDAFRDYCFEKGIVVEFTRFNPLFENHKFSTYMQQIKANIVIAIDLTQSVDDIRMLSYKYSIRQGINRARRKGVTVKTFLGSEIDDNWIDVFTKIYHSVMKKNKAENSYFFSTKYFSNIKRLLDKNSIFGFAIKDDVPISCELDLFCGKMCYGFLGGTLAEYFRLRPNDILKDELLLTLKKMGSSYYCMGGGIKIGDNLYQYKKNFCKDKDYDFYIGKKIHNKEVYDNICKAWAKKFPLMKDRYQNMVLKYRFGE